MSENQANPTNSATLQPGGVATSGLRYREAFQKISAEVAAVDPTKFVPINVDVTSSYTTVLGALPRIAALRERASHVVEFDVKYFDILETYALALMHAQGEYVSASAPPEEIVTLSQEGNALRDALYSDAVALANRGVISGVPLADLKAAPGYKNLGEDLLGLSSLIRRSWDKIASRTVITMAELDRAEQVSDRLLQAVASREQAANALVDAIQQRQRTFTLFVNAYDQVRRAVSFLRWEEGDLEEIAPSLYAGRGRRKSEPEQPVPPPTTGPIPPVVGAPSPVGVPSTQAPASAVIAGIPQGNPFASNGN
ncbi:MAG: hypothetical protein ABW061_17165 [Polyangiaceae bacterium]